MPYIKNNQVDFVSIMHVCNETGAVNDIKSLVNIAKSINNVLGLSLN